MPMASTMIKAQLAACLLLAGCGVPTEDCAPQEFMRRYDEVRYDGSYYEYVGVRDGYCYMKYYGMGHNDCVAEPYFQSRLRTPQASLPHGFPDHPQPPLRPSFPRPATREILLRISPDPQSPIAPLTKEERGVKEIDLPGPLQLTPTSRPVPRPPDSLPTVEELRLR